MRTARLLTWAIPLVSGLLFAVYAVTMIGHQSFYGIDGHRYFSLADDALITLRYGWNVAHGHGLVWNPGERVEGTTSILGALQASGFSLFLERRFLPLAIQCSAVGWLLLTGFCFLHMARACLRSGTERAADVAWGSLAFLLPLSYSPLVFWSLRGMETSLQAALFASGFLLFLRANRGPALLGSALLGLSCMARPDSIVPCSVVFGFRMWAAFRKEHTWQQFLAEVAPWLSILVLLTVFRVFYYGSPTPNTYMLKVHGMSAVERIRLNGIGYATPFVRMSLPLVAAVAVSLALRPSRTKALLAAIPASMLAYTVYVGGDAFDNWRFLAPYVPYAFMVLLLDLPYIDDRLRRFFQGQAAERFRRCTVLTSICLLILAVARPPFYESYVLRFRCPQEDDIANVNTAIWLNRVLKPSATVGVFYAGSIPFYTDFYAMDFFGKSDPGIASLQPDKSGAVSWGGLGSVPGHNKYDLNYSILERMPTYVQGLKWGRQDVTERALKLYDPVRVDFPTWFYSGNDVLLRKGSPLVRWELAKGTSVEKAN